MTLTPRRDHGAIAAPAYRDDTLARVARALADVNRQRVLLWLGCAIAFFGLMGTNFIANAVFTHGEWIGATIVHGHHLGGFNLDGEMNYPAAFSGLLDLSASVVGLLACAVARRGGVPKPTLAVALLVGYMSIDEVWTFHERLETWLGIDWQTIYLPIFAAAGVAGAVLARDLRGQAASRLLVGGGAAWAVAQVIEKVQWDGDRLLHPWSIVPEETLEMTGSMLFLFAFLDVLRTALADRDGHEVALALRQRLGVGQGSG